MIKYKYKEQEGEKVEAELHKAPQGRKNETAKKGQLILQCLFSLDIVVNEWWVEEEKRN